jgi:N-carbamoylputrescine amidase
MTPIRIALAQLAAGPDRAANLARVLDVMGEAKRGGADLITFPEIILDRFFPASRENREAFALAEPIPGPTSDRIAERARELGLVTVFNLYELDLSTGSERRFDSSPVFDADGRLLGVTRMVHITDYEGFYEQTYYHPGDLGVPVYDTRIGRVGVAICYDRHYPEVMRALGVAGAELVVIPQAGAMGEWPEGLYEAEVRTAAFQNGYFVALANRVGSEGKLQFAGESFVVDPDGTILARSGGSGEDLLLVDIDLGACQTSHARRLFWQHRRPEIYGGWS